MPQFRYLSPKEYETLDLDQKVAYIEAAAEHLAAQKGLARKPPQQQQQQQQQQPPHAKHAGPATPEKGDS
jgi:hypothetical protein